MPEVMREGDCFSQVFVQAQSPSDVPRNAGHFHRVRQSRSQVVPAAVQENLCFVFQPAEGTRMNYPIAVALIVSAPFWWFFGIFPSTRGIAELRVRSEELPLA